MRRSPRLRPLRPLLAGLLCALAAGCTDRLLGPHATPDHAAVFDELWREFDLHYALFPLKGVNWAAVGATYRPRALAATSEPAFASILGEMLDELRDPHVELTPTGVGGSLHYLSRCDTIALYFEPGVIFQRYVPVSALTPGGHMRYGMATPAVGYIQLSSFVGEEWGRSEIDAALAALPGARTALIIDIRNNRGGAVENATQIAGRFADRSHVYGYLRLRNGPGHDDLTDFIEERVEPGPNAGYPGAVFVLTNRRDFSSAEDFVLAMRVLPRVTVVGDTTAGASGGPLVHELPNGWTYELPEWIEYTPDHRIFEEIGLAPQVVVKPTARDTAGGVDPVLERALQLARQTP
jgi:hypothetical protein